MARRGRQRGPAGRLERQGGGARELEPAGERETGDGECATVVTMHSDSLPPLNLRRRALRAVVLASSVGLAAFLVLRAGGVTGCDGPASPQQPASGEATKRSPAPDPTPVRAETPAPKMAEPEAAEAPSDAAKGPGVEVRERGPSYLPASKAGVFLERSPEPLPPAREPAVQQEAPSQQQVTPE